MKRYVRSEEFNEYLNLRNSYKHMKKFADTEIQSGDLQDLIDRLDASHIAYEIYEHKKDGGCTVFYNDLKSSIKSSASVDKWYMKYYDISQDDSDYVDEVQDTLDSYDMIYVADLVAKNKYYDALADNGLESLVLTEDAQGRRNAYQIVHNRVYDVFDEVNSLVEEIR